MAPAFLRNHCFDSATGHMHWQRRFLRSPAPPQEKYSIPIADEGLFVLKHQSFSPAFYRLQNNTPAGIVRKLRCADYPCSMSCRKENLFHCIDGRSVQEV